MIIGITGTNGAGKGAVVDYLVEKNGFKHFSVRAFIVEEVKRRGLEIDRTTIMNTANDLRAQHGATYIIAEILKQIDPTDDAIVESVREVQSVGLIHEQGGIVIAVDADAQIRYERIQKRATETDRVDFDTFMKEDQREYTNTDPTKQNVMGVFAIADYKIVNNGTLEELHAQVDSILEKVTR